MESIRLLRTARQTAVKARSQAVIQIKAILVGAPHWLGDELRPLKDPAMAESFVDTFKTELIADRVWRTRSQLELAIVEYLGWLNTEHLHESLGDIPPAELDPLCAAQTEGDLSL